MTLTDRTLFKLLALGLGHDVKFDIPLEDVDWPAVVRLAMTNGLDAIAFDGLSALYQKRPDLTNVLDATLGNLKFDWLGYAMQAEQDYEAYRGKLEGLAAFFGTEGFRMLVMKGYGLSLDYPVPSHRPTGDIDLYLYGRGAQADERLKEKLRITVNQEGDKHSRFSIRGLSVENHASFLNVRGYPSLRALERFLEQEALNADEVRVGKATICVPTVTMNAMFLPCHMAAHFVFEGMPLKQLVDWAVFLDRHGAEVDWALLRSRMEEVGRFEFLRALNGIMVSHLGVPADCLPDWGRDPALEERIWQDTLQPRKDLAARSLVERFLDYFRIRWKFRLVHKESFVLYFGRHCWEFVRGLFLPRRRIVWSDTE